MHSKIENCLYPSLLQPCQSLHMRRDIIMDFIEGLPKSKGYDTILLVVERLTKYGQFTPLTHRYIAKQVALVFLDQVYKLYGLPVTVRCY